MFLMKRVAITKDEVTDKFKKLDREIKGKVKSI